MLSLHTASLEATLWTSSRSKTRSSSLSATCSTLNNVNSTRWERDCVCCLLIAHSFASCVFLFQNIQTKTGKKWLRNVSPSQGLHQSQIYLWRAHRTLLGSCQIVLIEGTFAGWLLRNNCGGAVANRLRRRTSDQTVLGSNPAVAAALSPWTRLFTPIVPRRSLHISFYSYLAILVKYILAKNIYIYWAQRKLGQARRSILLVKGVFCWLFDTCAIHIGTTDQLLANKWQWFWTSKHLEVVTKP